MFTTSVFCFLFCFCLFLFLFCFVVFFLFCFCLVFVLFLSCFFSFLSRFCLVFVLFLSCFCLVFVLFLFYFYFVFDFDSVPASNIFPTLLLAPNRGAELDKLRFERLYYSVLHRVLSGILLEGTLRLRESQVERDIGCCCTLPHPTYL